MLIRRQARELRIQSFIRACFFEPRKVYNRNFH